MISKLIKNKLLWIILFGVFLRILFAAFLYHTDIKAIYRDSAMIEGGIKVAYEKAAAANSPLFYPPVTYVFFENYQKSFDFIFSSYFETWMNDWGSLHTQNHPRLFQDLFAMKLPLIAFDILSGLLIIFFSDRKNREIAAGLWFLNPVSLYAIYAFSQYDVIAVFILIVAIVLVTKKQWWGWAYLLLGIAASLKQIPLLIFPFLFLADPRSLLKKFGGLILGGIIYIILLSPIITSRVGLESVFLYNLNRGMFAAGFDLGNGVFLSLFMVFYLILFFSIYFNYLRISFTESVLILLGGLFALSLFNPQWILWVVGPAILLLLEKKMDWKMVSLWSLFYFGSVFLINDKFVGLGLLKSINNAFDWVPSFYSFASKTYLVDKLIIFFRGGFLAIFIMIAWSIVSKKDIFIISSKVYLGRITFAWILGIVIIFLGSHLILAKSGFYIDNEQVGENQVVDLTQETTIEQKFRVFHDGLAGVELRVKNVSMKSKSDVVFEIWSADKTEIIRTKTVNGSLIGDDYDLLVSFPRVADSASKDYWLVIKGHEIQVNIDTELVEGGLKIDGEERLGRLSYRVLYNPGGFEGNFSYSLRNISEKLWR